MADETGLDPAGRTQAPVVLTPLEQRVVGVLAEKALATPEYYPLTLKALVAGCNQRSNRHPITNASETEIGDVLRGLQGRGLVMAVKADTGWATRWRHQLDRRLGIQGRDLAVLTELLLRGPQTEGELRSRASRMGSFPDLETVQEALARLREWKPRLAVRLSPEGAVRGVRHAHALRADAELAALREEEATGRHVEEIHAPAPAGAASDELLARLAALEDRVTRLERALGVGGE